MDGVQEANPTTCWLILNKLQDMLHTDKIDAKISKVQDIMRAG